MLKRRQGSRFTLISVAVLMFCVLAVSFIFNTSAAELIVGDVDKNGVKNGDDAVYLLYNTLFGDEDYPVAQSCDFNKDGFVDGDDAIYLLNNTLFGDEDYPLPENGSSSSTSSDSTSSDKDDGFGPWIPIG